MYFHTKILNCRVYARDLMLTCCNNIFPIWYPWLLDIKQRSEWMGNQPNFDLILGGGMNKVEGMKASLDAGWRHQPASILSGSK